MTVTRTASPQTRGRRLVDAVFGRLLKLPPGQAGYTVARDLPIPMRDGVVLRADVLHPAGPVLGTVLLRSPYGFDPVNGSLYGGLFAARGYRVVQARVRGTFGSGGGAFYPMRHEVDDAADTVAWLREQPWFDGRFATFGGSYLGFTQWALLMDPPPELVTAIIQVGPHDFRDGMYEGGAAELSTWVGWADAVTHQEQHSLLGNALRVFTGTRRQAAALRHLPMAAAVDELCQARAPWFRDFATHRDPADPFWAPMQLSAALDRVQVPVLLQGGWQDLFLRQTLAQYQHLSGRGVDVALTVGPWTHADFATKAGGLIINEMLGWLGQHLAGTGTWMRATPVRLYVTGTGPGTGTGQWRDLRAWPPAAQEHVLYPQPGGQLSAEAAPAGPGPATFTYDPADPTPTIGGRALVPPFGYADDSALAGRGDVLAFTGSPLPGPVEVHGTPVAELAHRTDRPADLFVRISEVDPQGKSRNVSDAFLRLDPDYRDGVVRIELDPVAHRFAAGNRIRLLVAGGSFPRWERSLGTSEPAATSVAMAPSHRSIDPAGSSLRLPVV
ncbi:MAG TPA: CocE/NonD family hydrolase [Streptosporangiaceae bacterium]|nr:CocE/NonD family hydrolase [Streptosporangiaceae bacterium]